MSFTKAIKDLETAQQIAESSGDSATEFLAAGIAELARTLHSELAKLDSTIKVVEDKVKNLG